MKEHQRHAVDYNWDRAYAKLSIPVFRLGPYPGRLWIGTPLITVVG
jgi:hypothetical protein